MESEDLNVLTLSPLRNLTRAHILTVVKVR